MYLQWRVGSGRRDADCRGSAVSITAVGQRRRGLRNCRSSSSGREGPFVPARLPQRVSGSSDGELIRDLRHRGGAGRGHWCKDSSSRTLAHASSLSPKLSNGRHAMADSAASLNGHHS